MSNSNSKFKTIVVRDVELYWAKLDKPVQAFPGSDPAWEVVAQTKDESKANEWKAMNLNVKKVEKDGESFFKVGFKRKAANKAGKENPAPKVIFEEESAFEAKPSDIGNGSIGHIRGFQYDYEVAGRKGVATQFNAVKITKLKKYEGSDDIDF